MYTMVGAGLSDSAFQKSRTFRSWGPYSTSANVGVGKDVTLPRSAGSVAPGLRGGVLESCASKIAAGSTPTANDQSNHDEMRNREFIFSASTASADRKHDRVSTFHPV